MRCIQHIILLRLYYLLVDFYSMCPLQLGIKKTRNYFCTFTKIFALLFHEKTFLQKVSDRFLGVIVLFSHREVEPTQWRSFLCGWYICCV